METEPLDAQQLATVLKKPMEMGVFHKLGATQNGWFFLGKIPLKWMMTGGLPLFLETLGSSWIGA